MKSSSEGNFIHQMNLDVIERVTCGRPPKKVYRIVLDGNNYYRLQWDVDVGARSGPRKWVWDDREFISVTEAERAYKEEVRAALSTEVREIVKEFWGE